MRGAQLAIAAALVAAAVVLRIFFPAAFAAVRAQYFAHFEACGLPAPARFAMAGWQGLALAAQAAAPNAAPAGASMQALLPGVPLVFPLAGAWAVSSLYGWRQDPFGIGGQTFHHGQDLACAEGTPVLAAQAGVVCAAVYSTSYGNYLRIRHSGGVETLYAHMQYLFVRSGEVVRAGQPLGTAGQTGRATGAHLHFELWQAGCRYDPAAALAQAAGTA